MIDKISASLIEYAGKALNAVGEHLAKNWKKYFIGAAGGAAVGGAAVRAIGKPKWHMKGKIEGKKEGKAEQAAVDEKKYKDMHQKHEQDRKRWEKQKKDYEDILDDIENQ